MRDVRIGRFTEGFALDGGPPTAKAKLALLERWVGEQLARPLDWGWINLLSRIEAVLLPSGDLARRVRALHDLYCEEFDDRPGRGHTLAARLRALMRRPRARLLADLEDRSVPPWKTPPMGEATEIELQSQAGVLRKLVEDEREGDDVMILTTALYAPLYSLAWLGMDEGVASLVSLPVRVVFARDLASLGASERLTRPRDVRAALKKAVVKVRRFHPKLRFDVATIDTSSAVRFASTFVRALHSISFGRQPAKRVTIERRPLLSPVSSFAANDGRSKLPRTRPFDAELRADHAVLVARGLKMVGAPASAPPEEIVEKVHRFVSAVQKKRRRLVSTSERAAIAVVWGEQLVRALGWQWTRVVYAKGAGVAGVVSPDRALAHFPLGLITRLARANVRSNTIALVFNTLRDGDRPSRAKRWTLTPVE